MNKLAQVFGFELKRNLSRKGFIFTTLGIPALALVVMLGFQLYQTITADTEEPDTNPIEALVLETVETAGLVDYSGVFTEIPADLQDVLVPYADEQSALAALESGEIDTFFVFAEDYLETGDVSQHLPSLQIMLLADGDAITQQLAYRTFASGLDSLTLRRLSNPASFERISTAPEGEAQQVTDEGAQDGQFLITYIFTLIFFVSIMLSNTYLMQTVIDERDNRMVEILVATVRPVGLLGGKILALSVLALIQLLFWALSMGALFVLAGNLPAFTEILSILNIELRADLLPLAVVYFLLTYLLVSAIFGAVGAVSGSAQEGSQYAGIIVLPLMLPFIFFQMIQAEPNGTVATILSLLPGTAPIGMLSRMIITDVAFWQVGLSVLISAFTAVGAMWMAGRVFRVQTLLSGQPLKPTDLPRLIFAENAPRR